MCCQHSIRASAGDNTGQNTKDTHLIPGQKLKFLTPPEIEPVHATATDNNKLLRKILLHIVIWLEEFGKTIKRWANH